MKSFASHKRIVMWSGCVFGALFVAAASPSTTMGAERMVLGEEFTATW